MNAETDDERFAEWTSVLLDQAILAEGGAAGRSGWICTPPQWFNVGDGVRLIAGYGSSYLYQIAVLEHRYLCIFIIN